MLEIKSNTLKIGDVAVLKLITGEEVIGRVNKIGVVTITLTKVGTLLPVQSAQGVSIAMQPYMFGVDSNADFTFAVDKYVIAMPAIKQAADMYLQQTSSIKTASPADLPGIDLSKFKN